MNKKGLLLAEETLKIIVAVICVGFLVYVLVNVYYSNEGNKEVKEAKNVLYDSDESIRLAVNQVKIENGSLEEGFAERFILNNPDGWHIFSFTGEKVPNKCAGKNCICICEKVVWDVNGDRQISRCDEGACLLENNLNDFEEIEITENTQIIIKKIENKISIIKNGD